jgi:hypothetical protein
LIQTKTSPPELEKFGIKYGCEVFDIRNTFPYWNFSRYRKGFEIKFREASMSWIQLKILGTLEFDEIWPTSL